jgi:hypothetical protein
MLHQFNPTFSVTRRAGFARVPTTVLVGFSFNNERRQKVTKGSSVSILRRRFFSGYDNDDK